MWDGVSIGNEVSNCPEWRIIRCFEKYLPEDKLILEAGSGIGTWLIYLRDKGYNIEGVEHDRNAVVRLKEFRQDIPVRVGDIRDLPYDDNSLGAYISLGVLEHFEEGAEQPLLEARRVLMPGGIIVLTVPFNNLFRRIFAHPLRDLYLMIKGSKHFAEYRYSKKEACDMLAKAGFHLMETGTEDFISKDRSLVLWSEFPFLRKDKGSYSLNMPGRIAAYCMNSISYDILSAGILVVGRKV